MTEERKLPDEEAVGTAPMYLADNKTPAMLQARKIVEDHIANYGMVPHPDKLKEAIAGRIAQLEELSALWKDCYEAAEQAMRATEHHCEELLRERGFFS